jgi:hydroxymethylpyrimidine pyrophosphatase-like HAD family hydrolase
LPAPVSSLPISRADLRGLVFDIDDTVTRDGRLEACAYAAMQRLADAGVRLVAVTGRPLGWTDVVAHMWPVDLAVGENGAGWAWRDGPRVHEGYAASDDERIEQARLLDRVREQVGRTMPHVQLAADQRARRCDLAFDIGETVQLPAAQVQQLANLIAATGARSLISTVHAHAVPGSWDKASGTIAGAAAIGIDLRAEIDRWVFIGDSPNDAAAFERFPLSVGVANVTRFLDDLPQPPRFITTGDRGRGFAELVDHLMGAPA